MNFNELCKSGREWYNRANYEAAIGLLDMALKLKPADKETLTGRAFCLMKMKQYERAIEVFDQLIDSDPIDIRALYQKGDCLLELKQFEEAISCFDVVIALHPDDARTYHKKGLCLYQMSKYETARDCFEISAKQDKTAVFSVMFYGLCSFWIDQEGDGLKILQKLCEKYPIETESEYRGIHYQLALCLFVVGDYEEAIQICDQLQKKYYEMSSINHVKGICLQELEKYKEAIYCFEGVYKNDPDYDDAQKRIIQCKIAINNE